MGKRLLVLLVVLLGMAEWSLNLNAEPLVPAVYIFGDSIFDVGTNRFVPNCTAQADTKPYGIDFPNSQPTGRFSNGYNTADEIAMLLGFEMSPPPFLMIVQNDTEYFRSQILKGVNFASGGSGVLDETGQNSFNRVISMGEQIQQFATVRRNISEHLNCTEDADTKINESLFLFSAGSNDFFDLYHDNNNSVTETMRQNQLNKVMDRYQNHLENLKNYGARKFGILSIPPIGCAPVTRLPNGCNPELNAISNQFHILLEGALQNLTSRFPEMKYSIANAHNMSLYMINIYGQTGVMNITSPCCGTLTDACGLDSQVCEDRQTFLFWDQYHPVQNVSELAASEFLQGQKPLVTPINLGELVRAS